MSIGHPYDDTGWLPAEWPYDINRADMDPEEFLALLWNRGVRALWQSVAPCPCGETGGQGAKRACTVCGGTGIEVFQDQEIRTIVSGLRRSWEVFNERANIGLEPGEAIFTVRGEHIPADGDRIILVDARTLVSNLLRRGTGTVDTLRTPVYGKVVKKVATPAQGATGDEVTLDVLHCRKRGTDELAGALLVKGTDFTVDTNGNIDWTLGIASGSAPEAGSHYSLVYYTRPVYRVTDQPHAIRDMRHEPSTYDEQHYYLPGNFRGRLEWTIP